MTYPIVPTSTPARDSSKALSVVLCGSFRRDSEGLRRAHHELIAAGIEIISPLDLDFVAERDGFVFAAHEVDDAPADIEDRHLRAMQAADFVWLHAPAGYIGRSAAMELGYAHALGVPVYAACTPVEPGMANKVRVVAGPRQAIDACTPQQAAADAPTRALRSLQDYYARAAALRGWSDESAQEGLLLLQEEVGELSRAVRRTRNGQVEVPGEDPALELADVALYVVHMANILNVDLALAVSEKERINAERFARLTRLAA